MSDGRGGISAEVEPAAVVPAPDNRARIAVLVLALCCFFWGLSFPVMPYCMLSIERHILGLSAASADDVEAKLTFLTKLGVTTAFMGWRFGLAAILYFFLTRSRQRNFTAVDFRGGIWVGGLFTLGMIAQIGGLRYTRPSVSGFLTSLVVVYTPLMQALIFRRSVARNVWLGVFVALIGMTLLSLPNPAALAKDVPTPPIPFLGEGLTVLCALFFSGQMLAVDHFALQMDTTKMTFLMFVTLAILSSILGVACAGRELYRPEVVSSMLGDSMLVGGILCLVVFSSVVSLHLMNTFQPHISAAMASVVYCLEPLFATLFSVLLGAEVLTAITMLGGAVILAAVMIVVRKT